MRADDSQVDEVVRELVRTHVLRRIAGAPDADVALAVLVDELEHAIEALEDLLADGQSAA